MSESDRGRRAKREPLLPPSGTVTFLLTDIEASTSGWEADHNAMAEVLRRHDAVFRELTQQNDGFIVESGREGDSVLVAFRKASDAVACTLTLQRTFGDQTWSVAAGLKVRMALHTGEAEFRGGHYFGQPINRCARLLSSAHGGQVLMTSATRDLVGGVLLEPASLADLGMHRFKDLSQPEHVFQLMHPDLRSVFPALRSLDQPPANLPLTLTSFVGRERALEELKQLLHANRLLTLIGPGGCGKTRLAVELATGVVSDFPDGVWFVDLVPLTDPSLVPQKVLAALGLRERADRGELHVAADYLKSKRALLILDNCEHLVNSVAEFADAVLRAAPTISVLATSREVLRVSGEVVWPVPPLALPDNDHLKAEDLRQWEAVRLFTERAVLSLPSFTLTMENAAAVAAICRQLDGLPLAIELAAARIAMMSPQQFLSRLRGQLKLLSKGSRIASPKQQTLEATFDWSYQLLSEQERSLFRRLSVFSSPFSLDEVEAVCAGEGAEADDVLDLITQLTEKSLVVPQHRDGQEVRYRLLETVRRYAQSRLQEHGEEATLQLRLARLCASLAEQAAERVHGPEGPAWMDVLEEQSDNLRAVLDWCRSTDPAFGLLLAVNLIDYWDWKGHLTEGRRWLAAFLDLNPVKDVPHAAALIGAGLLAWRQGDSLIARRHYEECHAIARSMNDEKLTARALRGLADALVSLGDYGKAEALCRESLAIFRQVDDVAEIAQTLSRVGNAIQLLGDVAGSSSAYVESLTFYRRLGDQVGIGNQLWSLGFADAIAGQYPSAVRYLDECLRIREGIRDELGVPFARIGLGYANTQLRKFEDARSEYLQALPKVRDLGDRWGISVILEFMVGLAVGEGMMAEGLRLAGFSESVRASIGAHELSWIHVVAEGWFADARRVLTSDEADRAYEEGRRSSPEGAVEQALSFLAQGGPRVTLASTANRLLLSRRELQVARLVAKGLTNREIARGLFISERTVDNHVKHVLEKLEFRSRSQVGAWLLAQDSTTREQPSSS